MAAKKLHHTLADYVTMALSPVLIMALVGSLVFFLHEVLAGGQQFDERVRWTLFWFIFGIVLVARISMHPAVAGRAGLYGIILAAVVLLALGRFLTWDQLWGGGGGSAQALTPNEMLLNVGLICVIWWSAYKLTWDCTYIDDSVIASGKTVLDAAGLEQTPGAAPEPETRQERDPADEVGVPSVLVWWDRYRRYRQEQRTKPHTPGVWVVYFSLAALPLFGLGQALVPADDVERRRSTFWLLFIYVASGLGLLLTTTFLGLRRYLRQRKLQMPVKMAATWMILGGILIAVLLTVGALLPRPNPEYSLLDVVAGKGRDRDASRYAQMDGSPGKGDGKATSDPNKDDPKAADGQGAKRDPKSSASRPGNQSSDKKSSQSNPNQKQGNSSDRKGDGGSGDKNNDPDKQQKQDPDDQQANDQDRDKKDKKGKDDDGQSSSVAKGQRQKSDGSRPADSRKRTSSSSQSRGPFEFPTLGKFGTILKWIVFIVLGLVVLFYLLRSGLRFLANFTDWARRLLEALRAWWAALFGGGAARERGGEGVEEAEEDTPYVRPFASYADPFESGMAGGVSPNQVVRYSFEALQAWARERGLGRNPQETPLEFANRLGREVPALEDEVRRAAGLYVRVAYAKANLKAGSLEGLRSFWRRLREVAEQPLSA
jgi:hypothetical protein